MNVKDPEERLALLALIDGCKSRGVMKIKAGDIEVIFMPDAHVDDALSALTKSTYDSTKCRKCQINPPDGRVSGFCRGCALSEAGVAS